MRKTLQTREERFEAGVRDLTSRVESYLGQLRRISPPYGHREWMRELVEAATDVLRSDTPDSQRYLNDVLHNPPQGIDQALMDSVTRVVDQALALPTNQKERNELINELEHLAERIVTGPAPGQGPPAGLIQKYQQAVIRRRQAEE